MNRPARPTPALLGRRQVLKLAAASALAGSARAAAQPRVPVKAIGFDGFVIFDPRPIADLARQLYPDNGEALSSIWRTRQFEYTWLRTLTGHYTDFWKVTEDALVYAADAAKVALPAANRDRLMQAWLELKAYPDVPPGLRALRDAGIRLAFLSNLTERMLQAAVASAGLEGLFELNLSTDRVGAFKPDPRAYRMAIDAFGLPREQIAFAAFGGWDAAGAKSFGYRTFWANRLHLPVEQLGVKPDAIGDNLQELVRFAAEA